MLYQIWICFLVFAAIGLSAYAPWAFVRPSDNEKEFFRQSMLYVGSLILGQTCGVIAVLSAFPAMIHPFITVLPCLTSFAACLHFYQLNHSESEPLIEGTWLEAVASRWKETREENPLMRNLDRAEYGYNFALKAAGNLR